MGIAVPPRWLARIPFYIQRLRWRVLRPLTVGVRLLAVQDGNVILVKHTYTDGWYLPGGGVQAGETLVEAVRREASEETGAVLHELRLFGVYSSFFEAKSDHIVLFCCEDFERVPKEAWEVEQIGSFALDDLPDGTSPGTRRRIAEYAGGASAVVARW